MMLGSTLRLRRMYRRGFGGIRRLLAIVGAAVVLATPLLAQETATPPIEEPAARPLSPGGWCFMLLSLGFVWGLAICCYRRVLSSKSPVDPGPAGRP